ncbi:DUF4340 domain-containing protein [Fulvivirga sediminis]|uniref:DUF4340 domain-containing protein n=1 Tax=Fulvivirga sediminis TaxID=2803949 RepID=A0A937F4E4_9BACT|nr:DUF4340 domain-containing protein [Fulvivirga sediminis]MBL3656162.1 DUF4340 domain-containing protein [Fulvivirga sediminis]
MQRKRNIKLIVVLVLLMIATVVAYYVTRPADKLEVDRTIFAYEDPSAIGQVVFEQGEEKNNLTFNGAQWQLNNAYDADPQRVSVVFALLKQQRVRRMAARQQQDSLQQAFEEKGVHVTYFEGANAVKDFYVLGDNENKITYMAESPGSQAYIVEIPGYRSYLAGIYELDQNGWRNPRIFDFNWANLKGVEVAYSEHPDNGFSVGFDSSFYEVRGLVETDSSRLTDFLDDVSLLYANDFLNQKEVAEYQELVDQEPQAIIMVHDVADKIYTLEVYQALENNREIIGRKDSTDYAIFDLSKMRKILRPKGFFKKKKQPI